MELNVDINRLVELEVERQVKIAVEGKLKELTMKKLSSMGYDVKRMIENVIREEINKQLNIKDFAEHITHQEVINYAAELFKEEILDAVDRRGYRY